MSSLRRRTFQAGLVACAAAAARSGESDPPEVTLLHNESVPTAVWTEVLALLGREAGLRWRLKGYPWARAQMLAQQGEGLLFGPSATSDRQERLRFSLPFADSRVWVVQRQGERWPILQAEDLGARRVCMSRSSRYSDRLEAMRATWPRKEFTDAGVVGVTRMVRASRCDVGLVAVRGIDHAEALATLKLRSIDMEGLVLQEPWIEKLTMHFAAARGHPMEAWIARLDPVIQTRRAEFDALLRAASPSR